jgi:GTP-binding protein HflX
LHVIDAASPNLVEQQQEVDRVLREIGAEQVPQLLVYNKCDLLDDSRQPRQPIDWVEVHAGRRRQRVFVSARTGQGLDLLRQAIGEHALMALNNEGAATSFTLPDGSVVVSTTTEPDSASTLGPPHQHA